MRWKTTTTLWEGLAGPGEGRSWERVVGHFHQPLVSFGRSLGLSEEDAEDATQETLVAFSESVRKGRYDRSHGRLSHWLYGIALRQVKNALRRGARRRRQVHCPDDTSFWALVPDEQGSPAALEEHARRQWELALLHECQARVREDESGEVYRAFEMVVYEGKKPLEVARQLGVSVKWVYNAKHRVLRRIRELRTYYDLEPAGP